VPSAAVEIYHIKHAELGDQATGDGTYLGADTEIYW
jgi:hypothetical protein